MEKNTQSKSSKYNRILILSPIIIAIVLVFFSSMFQWRNIDMGFKITPHMVDSLGQDASVKLDLLATQEIELIGDFFISIETGKTFEVWISPFLLNYADITITEERFKLRSAHSPQHQQLAEQVKIILPQQMQEQKFLLILSGKSQATLESLMMPQLILDTLGWHQVSLMNTQIETIQIKNIGFLTVITKQSQINNHQVTNLGHLMLNDNLIRGIQLNQNIMLLS
ncbi:hypothetical protein PVA45_01045 [Entomospira entomophila]|uniref:Uncharacterized protein n=1 Tax=Entomospira entomophila TaxID=2719988 RepID=A0A968GB21_9SPIO|nr:hypothetical protein [Entomospira entomophilus]NIZ40106.1 hypothetical protein [Entomospira entomophilus]WDI35666.1 hypothetical protein PVA45_01045 [Entomospira entomophilus]